MYVRAVRVRIKALPLIHAIEIHHIWFINLQPSKLSTNLHQREPKRKRQLGRVRGEDTVRRHRNSFHHSKRHIEGYNK